MEGTITVAAKTEDQAIYILKEIYGIVQFELIQVLQDKFVFRIVN